MISEEGVLLTSMRSDEETAKCTFEILRMRRTNEDIVVGGQEVASEALSINMAQQIFEVRSGNVLWLNDISTQNQYSCHIAPHFSGKLALYECE